MGRRLPLLMASAGVRPFVTDETGLGWHTHTTSTIIGFVPRSSERRPRFLTIRCAAALTLCASSWGNEVDQTTSDRGQQALLAHEPEALEALDDFSSILDILQSFLKTGKWHFSTMNI